MLRYACYLLVLCSCVVAAKPAERIVALAPHIVENLYAIGAGERIVATVEHADYPQAAQHIARVGGHHGIQIEKILALQPDLIIAWQSGNKQADLDKLTQLGLPVVYSEAKEIDQLAEELRYFGQLTAREAAAEKVAQAFTERLLALRKQYQNSRAIAAFYQLWPDPLMTVGPNSWLQQVLDVCQAGNVFATAQSDYPQISIENVIAAQPEVIIIPQQQSGQANPSVAWQHWPSIPAVKQQQLITVDADLLHRYSVRMLNGVADLCVKLQHSRAQLTVNKGEK